jgi:hypothetical protein
MTPPFAAPEQQVPELRSTKVCRGNDLAVEQTTRHGDKTRL